MPLVFTMLSVLFSVLKMKLLLLPSLRTCLPRIPIYQGLLTQELKTNIADDISTSSQTDVMQRRNIHSLLTLAAEPSKPQCKCSCTTTRLATSVRVDRAGKT